VIDGFPAGTVSKKKSKSNTAQELAGPPGYASLLLEMGAQGRQEKRENLSELVSKGR